MCGQLNSPKVGHIVSIKKWHLQEHVWRFHCDSTATRTKHPPARWHLAGRQVRQRREAERRADPDFWCWRWMSYALATNYHRIEAFHQLKPYTIIKHYLPLSMNCIAHSGTLQQGAILLGLRSDKREKRDKQGHCFARSHAERRNKDKSLSHCGKQRQSKFCACDFWWHSQ